MAVLDPLQQDTLLYFGSTVLAASNFFVAAGLDYRQWGLIAMVPYSCATVLSFLLRRSQMDAAFRTSMRRSLAVAVFILAVLLPLALLVVQRAQATPGVHAQAEVAVIERCGDRVAANQNCYLANPTTAGFGVASASRVLDSKAFVPYLPAMAIFGLPNAAPIPTPLRDARVWMATFSLVVVVSALAISGLGSEARWRIFQVALVLPTGALPMVTGGDDLPVLSLLLLSAVLLNRKRWLPSGLAMGVAVAMKLTAWPVALLFALAMLRNRQGLRSYASGVFAIALPVLAAGTLVNPKAFLVNELLFPLGLTAIKSPAQSPLLGQAIFSLLPKYHLQVDAVLVAAGALAMLFIYRLLKPRTLDAVLALAAAGFVVATVLAPATRFGYLIYPANLALWAGIFYSQRPAATPVFDIRDGDGITEDREFLGVLGSD